jgi:DNA-binding MarR family transcriptional regulator
MARSQTTEAQRQVLALVAAEGPIGPRRVAGEFGWRSQDAGRVLRALDRKGLIRFVYESPATTGWVVGG